MRENHESLLKRIKSQEDEDNFWWEVVQTKERFPTIKAIHKDSGKEYFLHSKYSPVVEAKRFVEKLDLRGKSTILILGFGAGYHLLEILRRRSDCKVLVVERNANILRACLGELDLSPIFGFPNLHFIIGKNHEEVVRLLKGKLNGSMKKEVLMVEHPVLTKCLYPLYYSKVKDGIELEIFPPKLRGEYKEVLLHAIRNGYKITTVIDFWLNKEHYKSNKIIILRHDVDRDLPIAFKMFETEKSLSTRATYYFRWHTSNSKIINQITKCGWEVGLHYETLANYAIEHKIRRREEITSTVIEDCRKILKEEIRKFKESFGEIYTVSAHGAAKNRTLGVSNRMLLEGEDLSEYGIVAKAYGEEWREWVDIGVVDTGNTWRSGVSLWREIELGYQTIYCSIHPCWWRDGEG
jgi:hypothetical protein